MKKALIVLFAMGVILVPYSMPCNASTDITIGFGRLGGTSTYSIGGHFSDNLGNSGEFWSPLSELEWPLEVWMTSVSVGTVFGKFSLNGELSTNVSEDAGDMNDSDWGVLYLDSGGDPYFSPYTKDIYSTTATTLEAMIMNLKLRYKFFERPTFALAAGVGLLYENFKFKGRDTVQYSPSAIPIYGLPSDPYAATLQGLTIKYDVTYTVPYFELVATLGFSGKFGIEASLGYSPFVTAEDEDDHVLRGKLSKGDCEGSALLFEINGRYDISSHWFCNLSFNYISIDTSGTQTQSYYAGELVGYVGKIDQEITSSQTLINLEAGYRF